MGATRNADGSITFCLAAPQKQSAMVVGSWNGYKYTNNELALKYVDAQQDGTTFRHFTLPRCPRGNRWEGTLSYFYVVDGSIKVGDAYASTVLDPYNDKYISPEVFPNLPEYPSGKAQRRTVGCAQEGLTDYTWQTNSFQAPAKTDLGHLRDAAARFHRNRREGGWQNSTVRQSSQQGFLI